MKPLISIYADGADLKTMAALADRVDGFTTNPSLMKKSGVTDYRAFAREALAIAGGKPVSLEVLADDFGAMGDQAREIASWGRNAVVKIPVTDTRGESSRALVRHLAATGIPLNVTAVMSVLQARAAAEALGEWGGIVSVFAGRICDTGLHPAPMIRAAKEASGPKTRVLWASVREIYNVTQAEAQRCDIITLSPELLAKLAGRGRDLEAFSLETVRQFAADAKGIAF